MSFCIFTDSSANVPDEFIDRYHLEVLTLVFRDENGAEFRSYERGKKTDLRQFYKMMREGSVFRTSLVPPEQALAAMEPVLASGQDILYIGFSSGLSGTCQSVRNAMDLLREKYPQRQLMSVDTLAAATGEGLLVILACREREKGRSIGEVCDWLEKNKLHMCHWFTVEDLKYLKRGGRISAAAAMLGTMLQIKPVMHMDDEGHLIPVSKVRGRRASLDALVAHMEELAIRPQEQLVAIIHGDCQEDAEYVRTQVVRKFHPKEIIVSTLDPVIGAHSGPGTVSLFFLGTHR